MNHSNESLKKQIKKYGQVGKYGIKGHTGLGIGGLFHVSMPYDSNGKVFVEWEYIHKSNDGTVDKLDGWKRMTLDRVKKEKRKVIKCHFCDDSAVRLDHHWPYMDDMNACAKHIENFKKRTKKHHE